MSEENGGHFAVTKIPNMYSLESKAGFCLDLCLVALQATSDDWPELHRVTQKHYRDVIIGAVASQITSLTIAYSTVYSGADQRKYQSPASLAFVRGIHRGPVNSPHKWPVTRKMFPFGDVIMIAQNTHRQL